MLGITNHQRNKKIPSHFTHPLGWLLAKQTTNLENNNCWQGCRETVGMQNGTDAGDTRVVVPHKSYNPVTPLWGIYPSQIKSRVSKRCLHIHVHSSIIHNAETRKPPKHLLRVNKLAKCGLYAKQSIIQPQWKFYGGTLRILY